MRPELHFQNVWREPWYSFIQKYIQSEQRWNMKSNFEKKKRLSFLMVKAFLYPGGRLNKKDGLTRYGDSHVKDKTS